MKPISNTIKMTASSLIAIAGAGAVIRGINQFPKPKNKSNKRRK